MIAVSFQFFDCWIALTCLTMSCCSSIGSEYPACPSWYIEALTKLTAGRLSPATTLSKSVRSYWWLAWPLCPISEVEAGGRWCGLAVDL